MAGSGSLTDSIRGWFERSPKAQRAVRRFTEDLDLVAGHVEKATSGLMEKVSPIIDPPANIAPPDRPPVTADQLAPTADVSGVESDAPPAIPKSESSIPPGVKRDGEAIDPTS